jgi:hypothetical protein
LVIHTEVEKANEGPTSGTSVVHVEAGKPDDGPTAEGSVIHAVPEALDASN